MDDDEHDEGGCGGGGGGGGGDCDDRDDLDVPVHHGGNDDDFVSLIADDDDGDGDGGDVNEPAFEVVQIQSKLTKVAPPIHVRTLPRRRHRRRPAADGSVAVVVDEDDEPHPAGVLPTSMPADFYVRQFPLNSSDPKDWATPQTFVCWHDCHPYTGLVISYPIQRSDLRGYQVHGKFCSFGCMLRYVLDRSDLNYADIAPMAQLMACEVYNCFDELRPAARRETLDMFTSGGQTIDEFRSAYARKVHVTLAEPPFYVAPSYMVSRPQRGHTDQAKTVYLEAAATKPSSTPTFARFVPESLDDDADKALAAGSTTTNVTPTSSGGRGGGGERGRRGRGSTHHGRGRGGRGGVGSRPTTWAPTLSTTTPVTVDVAAGKSSWPGGTHHESPILMSERGQLSSFYPQVSMETT